MNTRHLKISTRTLCLFDDQPTFLVIAKRCPVLFPYEIKLGYSNGI